MNKTLTKLALFTGIIFVLAFTPLGYINLPIASLTTIHIPVIIGSILFGTRESIYLGLIFGLTSFIKCFTAPDAVALIVLGTDTGFGLYNLLLILMIIFIPRILTGLFTNLSYKALSKVIKKDIFSIGIASFIGSMTNTVFFLGGLYIFAFEASAAGFGIASATPGVFLMLLLGIVLFNGGLEAIVAVILSTSICKAISKAFK